MSHFDFSKGLKPSFEEKTAESLPTDAPFFLGYSNLVGQPASAPEKFWLEETEAGAFTEARRDEDGDGYREIPWLRAALQVAGDPLRRFFPLAHYFDDRQFLEVPSAVKLHFLANYPAEDLDRLKALADSRDLEGTNRYFRHLPIGQDNPLRKIRPYLHVWLNLIAIHSGYGLSDQVSLENNPYGFSVTADGRWRVDCGIFAQLGQMALKKIPDLSFQYIYMKGSQPVQAHVVLLVSETQDRHLLVDNGSVLYFENPEPEKFLIDRFTERGYETLGKGGSEWKPFAKHETFYPEPKEP